MNESIKDHLEESKRQITELAKEVLLTEDDFENEEFFVLGKVVAMNTINKEHLVDLGNKRIGEIETELDASDNGDLYSDELTALIEQLFRKACGVD